MPKTTKTTTQNKTENGPPANKARVCAILLAAGLSTRFGSDKLQSEIDAVPLWLRSYKALLNSPSIHAVGIVTTEDKIAPVSKLAPEAIFVTPGGATRQQSAKAGIQAVPDDYDIVLIHDAARPFVTDQVIFNVVQGIKTDGAAYPVIPAVDTWRQVDPDTNSAILLDRSNLFAAQTPQGADRESLLKAHQNSTEEYTDDAALLAAAGFTPIAVPGDPQNIKITHQSDLQTLPNTPKNTTIFRTGLGYDIHSFSPDPTRPLWLGGVEFTDDKPGLEGHSDADALLHAVVDALLGAISAGDIGVHYPNSDPRWKDRPSIHFLAESSNLLRERGWTIVNIDATVIAERPKVMKRAGDIIQTIAAAAQIEPGQVSIKATTNEKLGSIGRAEGIAALAVATVKKSEV